MALSPRIRAKTVETLGVRRCTAMPPLPSVERQVAEIAAEPDRAAAYARLLHLQRACADEPSAAADLAAASPSTLLPLLLRDAGDRDEAVAASALKCLGFTLYHPVLVSTVSGQMAQLVLDTLIKLIMTTQMKAICNLGVWCISVQQLEAVIGDDRATSLLTAIVHAIDNPFCSLSTTFEAAQAIMKLMSQNPERMRELSSIWVPPIYRKLLSADKAERDMAERCLVKVSSDVLPPQYLLSKAIASDLEHSLLSRMLNMINDPVKKVQAVKSWGWYISLLGLHVVDNRPLLNKVLKVPEQMFIDPDTQVQISTMVAWRNLVNAFFPPQASETLVPETKISPIESRADTNAQLKKIRLIMIPLGRILSRSCNIALSSSCLITWYHLLYKLGDLLNHLPILESAFGPILKIIFSVGPDIQNKPLYSFCVNLFHESISAKVRDMASHGEYLPIPLNQNLLSQSCIHLKALMDGQRIRWLPWDASCFDFHLEILGSIVNPELLHNVSLEIVVTVMDSATQIFRSLVQGVQVDCKAKCAYDSAQICIAKVCKFVKKVFMDLVGKQNINNCSVLLQFGFQFVKVIFEELDHCLLASGTYMIGLDIEHIKEMQYADCTPKLSYPGIKSHSYMEMVSPAVYIIALSLSVVAEFTGEILHGDAEQLAIVICLSNFQENFHAAVSFMYKQIMLLTDNRLRMRWLMVWNKIAKRLNEQTMPHLKFICGASDHDVLYQFFCYPFFAFLLPGRKSTLCDAENSCESYLSLTHDLQVEVAIEVYKSICANSNRGPESAHKVFLGRFCGFVVSIIDENISLFQVNLDYCSEKKFKTIAILSTLGELVSGLLENAHILNYANKEPTGTSEESAGCSHPSLLLSCLKLVSRFMGLSVVVSKVNPASQDQITSRFFSSLSTFAGHLLLKKDVILFFEIIGEQLTEWLSLSGTLYCQMQQGETIDQLEKLWFKIVMCLKMSKLINDGSFLQKQLVLLQAALNHPHRPISIATTSAWRASRSYMASLQPSSCSISKLDESPMERGKDLTDPCAPHNAIVLEEIDILRKFTHPMLETEKNDESLKAKNDECLKISVGLGRKRMKIMKYSMKPRELGKNKVPPGGFCSKKDTTAFSSHYMESKVCRKPEVILEILKRKR